ncbi:MAG TPA: peptidase T [Bacteroidaceae bacterium]|nr:peptidase T [Bacteroidaceae bacterium]
MDILERFLRYTRFNTQSDANSYTVPSTDGQREFALSLKEELIELGLTQVELDNNGYLFATLPSNITKKVPVIGFIAHLDTSPDISGKQVRARVEKNYNGENIILNREDNVILSPEMFPELLNVIGDDIIVTDGKTLLGADDKAGIAEIISAIEYLLAHPEIPHGKVRLAFTPDEEIGRGADYFDLSRFGCDWAYTVDGGGEGELEYENFNAAVAVARFKGLNVHPGYSKNKMVNALLLANSMISMFPELETPRFTEKYLGFFHLVSLKGTVDSAEAEWLIRDHDKDKFEKRKSMIAYYASILNKEYGEGTVELKVSDQYRNMKEVIEPVMEIVDLAVEAMRDIGISPRIVPIRGGTDGARLSYMGLPCPNIFTGGMNFHSRYEYISVQSMEKAMKTIVSIIKINAR